MKKVLSLFVCLLFAASIFAAAGCSTKEEPAKPAAAPAKTAEPEKKAEEAKPAESEKKAEEAKTAETKPEEKAPEKK
jgi:hypothetical protein